MTAGERMKVCFVLLALSIHGVVLSQNDKYCDPSSFSASTRNCSVSSNCKQVTCDSIPVDDGGHSLDVTLSVENCLDPVRATLVLSDAGQCNGQFFVNGVEESRRLVVLDSQQLTAVFTRNASHLHFQLMHIGVPSSSAVLEMDVPLNPSVCMCSSMQTAADAITFPPLFPVTHHCAADTATCGGFLCNVTVQSSPYKSRVGIDPCTEVVNVNVMDSSESSIFQHSFNQSQSMPFDVTFISPVLYVTIDHYMYSMRVSVALEIGGSNNTILPSQQIILDRTSCSHLTAFPGTPVQRSSSLDCPSGNTTASPHTQPNIHTKPGPDANTTSPPSAGKSNLAVAVAVPVTLLMVTMIIVAVVVFVLLLFLRTKKRREVQFRRMAFDVMDDDDDDN